jgi:predicted DNA-binding protein
MVRSPALARAGRVTITAHLPREVRNRLQKLAGDLERTMNDLIAEALEDLFRKYGAPPIAPQAK